MSWKSLELPPVKNVSFTMSATKVAFVAADPATVPVRLTPLSGLIVFQSSPGGLSSTELPSSSKTWSTAGGGDGGGGRVGFGDGANGTMLEAVERGACVKANVPMNNKASTNTPNIHLAKFGFLVMKLTSYFSL
jgi:hypothetical protein